MEEIRLSWFQNDKEGEWNATPKGEMTVLEALERIRIGTSLDRIERIRFLPDKPSRDEQKFWLPAMTYSGIFIPTRANKNLNYASGLACLDFDHQHSPETFRDKIFQKYDFLLAAWISPSGDGVKALVRIPVSKNDEEYKSYYKALLKELDLEEADKTIDISRLCYESYDPNIRIKEDFNKVSVFDKRIGIDTQKTIPIVSKANEKLFNTCLAKLGGRGLVYTVGNRNNYIHALACETNRSGIPEDQTLKYTLSTFKELEQQETVSTIKSAYSNHHEYNKNYAELVLMAEATRIDINTPRPEESYILAIQGQPVAFFGGFTLITGKAKARKTHYNIYLTASFLSGTLGNHSTTLPAFKNLIIFFDTEESRSEAWNAVQKIAMAAGNKDTERLKYYSLRPYTPEERINFIRYIITTTPGIAVVFIDGVRDLVNDINSPSEATMVSTALLHWTDEQQIHIFCTLHLNKSDSNARGHLGTELVNKAQSIICIEKSPDVLPLSTISFIDGRGQGFKDYSLGYDSKGLPTEVDIEILAPTKFGKRAVTPDGIPINEHCNKLKQVFNAKDGMTYKELQRRVSEVYLIGGNKAVDYIKFFRDKDLTIQEGQKYFYNSLHETKGFIHYENE